MNQLKTDEISYLHVLILFNLEEVKSSQHTTYMMTSDVSMVDSTCVCAFACVQLNQHFELKSIETQPIH